jgi:predicted acylesterase/phospholipase RssA/CRP-like cAMP-binding protein
MADLLMLERSPLFARLTEPELREIAARMRPRVFEPGEQLCRVGEPSDRFWLITGGLVHLLAPTPGGGAGEVVDRLHKGDVVGEVGVIANDTRSATAVARISTSTLELDAVEFAELVQRFPQILINMISTLRGRLTRARMRSVEPAHGETVALAIGPSLEGVRESVVAAARRSTPKPVTTLDRQFSFAGAVTAADDLVSAHGTVLLPAELEPATIAALLEEVDRVVALAGTASEAARLGELRRRAGGRGDSIDVVLVGEEAARASRSWPTDSLLRVVRSCPRTAGFPISPADLAWLARHLTRTKLGLALGAGGAKGYAHIGALQVLEEAGYVVDFVSGSSIGAIVGAYLALGMDAAEADATLRRAFDPATVAAIFKTSLAGGATGIDVMTHVLRETTRDRSFDDTQIPLTIMTVDLSERAPAPLREGPLWQALLAATALPGVFQPQMREGHRLVDGLALVPVPTGSVIEDGADITVSVNLMSADTLERWPGGPPPEPPPERRRRGMLDTLLEVMDLSQLEDSVQHAGLADVVITPRFGPSDWRDFHLADLFLAAGRAAAEQQLPELRSLARPATIDTAPQTEGGGFDRANAVRI